MDHPSNPFGCFAAKNQLAALSAYGCGNIFDSHGFAINIKNLADELLPRFGPPAHVTSEHGYLRRE
jgi:hypothetical protein